MALSTQPHASPARDKTGLKSCTIIGGGPSAADNLQHIRGDIFACNVAIEYPVTPHSYFVTDPKNKRDYHARIMALPESARIYTVMGAPDANGTVVPEADDSFVHRVDKNRLHFLRYGPQDRDPFPAQDAQSSGGSWRVGHTTFVGLIAVQVAILEGYNDILLLGFDGYHDEQPKVLMRRPDKKKRQRWVERKNAIMRHMLLLTRKGCNEHGVTPGYRGGFICKGIFRDESCKILAEPDLRELESGLGIAHDPAKAAQYLSLSRLAAAARDLPGSAAQCGGGDVATAVMHAALKEPVVVFAGFEKSAATNGGAGGIKAFESRHPYAVCINGCNAKSFAGQRPWPVKFAHIGAGAGNEAGAALEFLWPRLAHGGTIVCDCGADVSPAALRTFAAAKGIKVEDSMNGESLAGNLVLRKPAVPGLSPRGQDLTGQYALMHENPKMFPGTALPAHIGEISRLAASTESASILDYGCGKATHHPDLYALGLHVTGYDPGIPERAAKPIGAFDATICTDVLEHIAEQDVPTVLADMGQYARNFVYMNVSTRAAKKNLPNGENAHATVRPREWWVNQITAALGARFKLSFRYEKDAVIAEGVAQPPRKGETKGLTGLLRFLRGK